MAQRCKLPAEGKSAERIRELLEKAEATQIVDTSNGLGDLYLGGKKPEAQRDARELSRILEVVARQLDVLHQASSLPSSPPWSNSTTHQRDDGQAAELRTDADISEWHRLAATLIRDLEKAGADRRRGRPGRRARGRSPAGMIGRLALGYRRQGHRVVPGSYRPPYGRSRLTCTPRCRT